MVVLVRCCPPISVTNAKEVARQEKILNHGNLRNKRFH
jgi:hypothetical protein